MLPSGGLGAYSAAKAGVEALGRSLRIELRPHDVTVAVAYYLFLNTPMVAAGHRSPVFQSTNGRMPPLIGRTWALEPAVRRTVESIERRSRSVAHPRFLRGLMVVRGLLDNPLLEREIAPRRCRTMEAAFEREAERVGSVRGRPAAAVTRRLPDRAARRPRRDGRGLRGGRGGARAGPWR